MSSIRFIASLLIVITISSCSSNTTILSDNNFKQVELPDGSVISLNKNSSVNYSEDFSTREISLKGEALFEVVEGNGEFTVTTENGQIVVLGTIFNVKDSDDELDVEVEEGEVNVKAEGKENRVKKGDRASFKKGKGLQLGKADFKHQAWVKSMKADFKAVGKEFKSASRDVAKGSKEVGKDLGKAGKKLGKELKGVVKEAEKEIKD